MADDDTGEGETRALQESLPARRANLIQLQYWGAYNLVKVVAIGDVRPTVRGYITLLHTLSGKTPGQMESLLGLRAREFANGADVYRLQVVPTIDEFWPRGYSTLVNGLRLPAGQTVDSAGYQRGQGAWQVQLRVEIPASFVVRLLPDERFNPGLAPSTAALYGR